MAVSAPRGPGRAVLDLLLAQRQGRPGIERRQRERLAALVAFARARSPFYAAHLAGLPAAGLALADLPPVSRPQLMGAFDRWLTDRSLGRAEVEAFVADPSRVGTLLRGKYFVCTSSGTTGHPGLFLHDQGAVAVNRALVAVRLDLAWLSGRQWLDFVRRGARWAEVVGAGGHFAGAGWLELERRRGGWRADAYRLFPVQRPLAELVAGLGAFDPTILSGYPSALELLASEQRAGRLHLRPIFVETAAESASPGAAERLAAAFGCPVNDAYGASELLLIAASCRQGWLHLNADWAILEPVDAQHRPVPPGEPSYTALLTNLANRIAPLIRYDLGDSVLSRSGPCPCGSPLPALRVAGRRDDLLHLPAADGREVTLLPLALGAALEHLPGVVRSQVVQTGPLTLRLRLELGAGADPEVGWREARTRLGSWLAGLGLHGVELVRGLEPPQQSGGAAKFRQVIAAPRG